MNILTILILPTHEHKTFFHLFVSFAAFLISDLQCSVYRHFTPQSCLCISPLCNLSFIYYYYYYYFNQSSILYTSVYTCQSQSPNSAHHHPHPTAVSPPWCPYVCSLHLCLNFCPANRFICTTLKYI